MADPVISVHGLGKKYRLRHQKPQRYLSLRDVLASKAKANFRFFRTEFRQPLQTEEFWALSDVSFDIHRGAKVGIIGRNGAGKSTLLKILSRITEPTTGRVTLRGRVASLLEVGTGFHPELTGRENIYLNGSILGMSRQEIRSKFDEIVAFAEVEKFLDTPVKHYSSGMHVRLAFAVAAHLQPEILVIDEVLAVGDAQFQKKCIGKMESVAENDGRTILFVSHHINFIEQLCSRVIHLDKGRICNDSTNVREALSAFTVSNQDERLSSTWQNSGQFHNNPWFKPAALSALSAAGAPITGPVRNDDTVWIQITADIRDTNPMLTVGYAIYSGNGDLLYWSYQTDGLEQNWPKLPLGRCVLRSRLPSRLLNQGVYRIELIGGLHFTQWLFEPGSGPSIFIAIAGGLSDSPIWQEPRPGLLAPVLEWEVVDDAICKT